MIRIIPIMLLAIIVLSLAPSHGQEDTLTPLSKAAIFTDTTGDMEMDTLAELAAHEVAMVFHRCGRLYPLDQTAAAEALKQLPEQPTLDQYKKAAAGLGCDLLVLISVRRSPAGIAAFMKSVSLSSTYAPMARDISFNSKVPMIVPLKLAREAAHLHANIPLETKILSSKGGACLINAGQWHGLKAGTYHTLKGKKITVTTTGRFTSMAQLPAGAAPGDVLTLDVFPDTAGEAAVMSEAMREVIHRRYSLQPGQGSLEDRFMTALFFNNLTVGVLVPGYGSYLSASGMMNEDHPGYGGIALTFCLMFTQLTLTENLTGYETNFFPWNQDSDKTDAMERLHIFLWATIPATVTASFMDQLANLLAASANTPPFFMTGDQAAAALSLFFPGAGLFYKGYRVLGWGYYFTEMALAGCGSYYWGRGQSYLYLFAALGAVKIIEIIHAYFADFSYDYCRREMDRPAPSYTLTLGMVPVNGRPVYQVGIAMTF